MENFVRVHDKSTNDWTILNTKKITYIRETAIDLYSVKLDGIPAHFFLDEEGKTTLLEAIGVVE